LLRKQLDVKTYPYNMKYLTVPTRNKALHRGYEGNTNEDRTGTAASGLLHHYFLIEKYIVTPEQTQEGLNLILQ